MLDLNNWTLVDLWQILCSYAAWLILSYVQGYAVGSITNVFSFRRLSPFRQFIASTLLAAGIIPALYSLVGTIGSVTKLGLMNSIACLNLILLTMFICALWYQRTRLSRSFRHLAKEIRGNRIFLILNLVWLVLGLTMLVDMQIGDKLYLNYSMHDHGNKVAFSDYLVRSNALPPSHPTYHPGHPVNVTVHFYWPLLCAAVTCLLGSPFDSRASVISAVIWSGTIFLLLLKFGSEYFRTIRAPRRQIVAATIVLLAVSNLYVLFALPLNIAGLEYFHFIIHPSVTFWTSEHVPPFVDAMTWVPHHIWGLVDGILASIFLLEACKPAISLRRTVVLMLVSAACLSSNMGIDVLTGMAFAFTWIAWGLVLLCKRDWRALLITIGTSVVGVVLTIPFLLVLFASSNGNFGKLSFGMKLFDPVDWLIPAVRNAPYVIHQLIYFLCLPLNYLVGLGFIMIGAMAYWREQRSRHEPIGNNELFLVTMTLVSIFLSSCVRSGDGIATHNDFGWRVIELAEFTFLFWTAEWLVRMKKETGRMKLTRFQQIILTFGVLTFIYGLYLDRTSTFMLYNPQRVYYLRDLYSQLQSKIATNAVVQHNPNVLFLDVDMYSMLYSHRQMVLSEIEKVPQTKDAEEYSRVAKELTKLFDDATPEQGIDICRRLGINVLVVKDTDKIWKNKQAWLWSYPVIASNQYSKAVLVQEIR